MSGSVNLQQSHSDHPAHRGAACPLSWLPYEVTDICFVGERLGWTTTNTGMILYTRDGGRFWQKHDLGGDHSLRSVSFVDERTGFALGERRTPTVDYLHIFSTDAVPHGPDHSAIILKTVDGGLVWRETSCPGDKTILNAMSFVEGGLGWAVGDCGVVLRTDDGGCNWRPVCSLTTADLLDVHFLDAKVGLVVGRRLDERLVADTALADLAGSDQDADRAGSGVVLRTNDGGETWSLVVVLPDATVNALTFSGPSHGWAAGGSGTMLATTDGGLTWSWQTLETPEDLNGVSFSDRLNGWTVGADGTSFRTADGGENWIRESVAVDSLHAVHCVDESTAWAAGANGVYLLASQPGGAEGAPGRDLGLGSPARGHDGAIADVTLRDSSSLRVREMQREDVPDVRRFFTRSGLCDEMPRPPFPFTDGWADTMEGDPWSTGQPATATYGLIAEEAGTIVGYLAIETAPERDRWARIQLSGGVAPHARRRGVASALVDQALEIIDSWLPAIRIECMMYPDSSASRALLHKYGFKADISVRAYVFRGGENTEAVGMSRQG